MTVSAYDDLERHGDEAFLSVSLGALATLGRLVGVRPRVLLLGDDGEAATGVVTPGEIADRLREMSHQVGDEQELSERIGWEIAEVLRDPDSLVNFNVEGLREICKAVELDWVCALPD